MAVLLSALIHAAILWLPYMTFPQPTVQLPPLSVRLEPLPKTVAVIAEKPNIAKSKPIGPRIKSDHITAIQQETKPMSVMNKTNETTTIQPFPKHLKLTFSVYKDMGGLITGEIHQQFDIHGDRYNLKSVRQTAGLTSLSNDDRIIQDSQGKIVETGLQPEIFEEQKITQKGTQSVLVKFDRAAGKLHYSNGDETMLSEKTQDTLSFLYQMSKIPMTEEFFPLPVSDGEQLQQYQIEIGTKESIDTPMGRLHTLHLRKMHAQGEAHFEIWLGLEYRLLPVKFRQFDSSGSVTEEFVISGICAKDE
jgi:hypothetical protein